MKKLVLIFSLATLLSLPSWAQSPQKMSYQSVVRNMSGSLVVESTIGIRISILQSTPAGAVVYEETHLPTTNVNGLLTIQIGDGSTSDDFSTIDWSDGPYFVKTEIDPEGGTNYTIEGISQLLSVPYALYAATSGSSIPGPKGDQGDPGIQGLTGPKGDQGDQGIQGLTGPKGDQGDQGIQGLPGAKGDQGDQGIQGLTGPKGDQGDPGIQGLTGPKGDQGDPGIQGLPGAKGDQGDQGIQGLTGPKGDQGDPGIQGLPGAKGDQGDQGIQGLTGPKGDQGDQGIQGLPGAKGDQGDQGIQGLTGPKGDQGDQGIQGLTGAKGDQGDQGIQGLPGAKGDQGDQGIQGLPGAKGDKGDTGDVGPQGPAGGNLSVSTISTNTTLTTDNQFVIAIGSIIITLPSAPSTGQIIHFFSDAPASVDLNPNGKVFRQGAVDYGTSKMSDFGNTNASALSLIYSGSKWYPLSRN